MTHVLDKEIGTFQQNKAELVAKSEGKFVLIHEGDVVGTYNDEQDAIHEGYKQFGNVPFLVKKIAAIETPAEFVNNHIGF